ncbi:hypothetical protein B0H21DRAFT_869771 [Amylocystis lapponica]|nr:hypothetical protein B0H21DRAFT_869771 [Amylocystis lapponica]
MHHYIQEASETMRRHNGVPDTWGLIPVCAPTPTIPPECCRDSLKEEWDLQINYSDKHNTEQKHPISIFADTNLGLPLVSSHVIHPHDKQQKNMGFGLMLWGHSAFEWEPVPLPEQPISPMERYRGHRTSASIISPESLSLGTLSSLDQLNTIEANVPESDDIEYLGRDSHMDEVLGWANDVVRCQPTISVPPRTPLMRPVVLPESAYNKMECPYTPIDVVLDEEAVVEDGCEVEMESAQAADGSTPDFPYFEGSSSERTAINGAPFPAPTRRGHRVGDNFSRGCGTDNQSRLSYRSAKISQYFTLPFAGRLLHSAYQTNPPFKDASGSPYCGTYIR